MTEPDVARLRSVQCTAKKPWDGTVPAEHPDAKEVCVERGWPSGDLTWYRCPHCELRFTVELPQ